MDEYKKHEGELKNEAELEEELDEEGLKSEEVKSKHFDSAEEEEEDTVCCDEGTDTCPV